MYVDENVHQSIKTVKLTFQTSDCVGHAYLKIGGNASLANTLEANVEPELLLDDLVTCDRDFPFKLDDDDHWTMTLKNTSDDTCQIDGYGDELGQNLVGIEIVKIEPED